MKTFAACFGTALLLAAALPSLASEFNKEEAKKLFEEKCSPCHTLERTLSLTKNREGWERTVKRMWKKGGSGISVEESKIITEYLVLTQGDK